MTGHNSDATVPKALPSKVLHVDIPEPIYWHLRRCAIESQMSIKGFVTELGRTASPVKLSSLISGTEVIDHSEASHGKAV